MMMRLALFSGIRMKIIIIELPLTNKGNMLGLQNVKTVLLRPLLKIFLIHSRTALRLGSAFQPLAIN